MAHFQRLSESTYAITYSQAYLSQGRYAEAITSTGAEAQLVDTRVPDIAFADATATLAIRTNARRRRWRCRQRRGLRCRWRRQSRSRRERRGRRAPVQERRRRFTDVTAEMLGNTASGPATAVVAGDYDNDGHADLAVLRPGGLILLRRDPAAGFTDVTAAAGLGSLTDPRSAAWLDADHDGDLDLFVARGAAGPDGAPATRLLRNNGTGRFTDITTESGLALAASGPRHRPDRLRQPARHRPAARPGRGSSTPLPQPARRHVPRRGHGRRAQAGCGRGDGRDRRREQRRLSRTSSSRAGPALA